MVETLERPVEKPVAELISGDSSVGSDAISAQKISYGITQTAEAYALAQSNMEQVLVTEKEPDWLPNARTIVETTPELEPYKHIFLMGAEAVISAKSRLNTFWQLVRQDYQDEPLEVDAEYGVETAGPRFSRALFESIFKEGKYLRRIIKFDAEPVDDIKATKGNLLWFHFSGEDYSRLFNPKSGGQMIPVLDMMPDLPMELGGSLPVIVMPNEDNTTILHEGQHAKDRIFGIGFGHATFLSYGLFNFDRQAHDNLQKRIGQKRIGKLAAYGGFESQFCEELEAFMTMFWSADRSLEQEPLPESPAYVSNAEIEKFFVDGLIEKGFFSETGLYNRTTNRMSADERQKAKQTAITAIKSLLELRQFEIEDRQHPAYLADTVAVKTLRLFDLREWPTVVKLIKAKAASEIKKSALSN